MCENHPFPTALRPLAMIEMACKRSLKVASSHHATTYYPYQMCTLPEWTITPGQPAILGCGKTITAYFKPRGWGKTCTPRACTLHKKPSQWWRIGEVNLSIWIPPYFSRIWWDYLCALKPIWQGMVVLYFGMGSLHAHREPPSVINFPFFREGTLRIFTLIVF